MREEYFQVPVRSGKSNRHRVAAPRKTKASRNPLQALGRFLYGTIVALSAVIVLGYGAFSMLVEKPAPTPSVPSSPQATVTPSINTQQVTTTPEMPIPPVGRQRREDVYMLLLAGTDYEGTRTDTMMVMRYDIPNQTVGVVSIPRDTLVERASGKNPKLVYGSGGVEARRDEIMDLLGIPIDYYIQVDLNAFVALVDYVGGVDFYVPCDMNYDDPYQNLSIHFKEGLQHLDGQEAMEVARFRKNNDLSGYTDVGRTQTQQDLLVGLAKKVLSWSSLTKINGFVELFETYVETDLPLSNMLYFASQAVYLNPSTGVETATLQGDGEAHYHGYSYCYALDKASTLDTVNRLLNPYDQDLTLEDMNLLSGT